MPKFTALVHVEAESQGVEETLQSLHGVANDLLVVLDREDEDKETKRKIRKCGGRLKTTVPGVSPGAYAMDSYHDWVLILRPGETLTKDSTERLSAWKKQKKYNARGLRLEIRDNGRERMAFRLVNKRQINWMGELPPDDNGAADLKKAA